MSQARLLLNYWSRSCETQSGSWRPSHGEVPTKTGEFRQVPVIDEGKLVGILTDRDLRQHLAQLSRTKVDAAMTALPFSVRPATPVEQAAHLLVSNKISSLPVVENGKLVGIITAGDMLHALRPFSETPSTAASESI